MGTDSYGTKEKVKNSYKNNLYLKHPLSRERSVDFLWLIRTGGTKFSSNNSMFSLKGLSTTRDTNEYTIIEREIKNRQINTTHSFKTPHIT